MSKVIYQPSGKAKEYSPWACNLYVGCSNDCSYCFNKRGVLGKVAGGPVAKLKSGIKDEDQAFDIFLSELKRYKDRIIRDGGLMFSFTTDPCLPRTLPLTMACVSAATGMDVPCHILTKCADWILRDKTWTDAMTVSRDLLNVGFTLTGRDFYDVLPSVYGGFEWSRENVRIKYVGFETNDPNDEKWSIVKINNEAKKIAWNWNSLDEEDESNFSMTCTDPNGIGYIYVTVDFPDDLLWDAYVGHFNSQRLTNTLFVRDTTTGNYGHADVFHDLVDDIVVRLQKGVTPPAARTAPGPTTWTTMSTAPASCPAPPT